MVHSIEMIIVLNERASTEYFRKHEDEIVKTYKVPDTLDDLYLFEEQSQRGFDQV
jgi:hypothetical protein